MGHLRDFDRPYLKGFKSIFAAFTQNLQLLNFVDSNPTPIASNIAKD